MTAFSRPTPALAAVAALAALAGSASAQLPLINDPAIYVRRTWPATTLSPTGAVIAGNFSGYFNPDLVAVTATQPILATAPAFFRSAPALSNVASGDAGEVATLAGGGFGKDAFAFAGNHGLKGWRWSSASPPVPEVFDIDAGLTSNWVGVTRLRATTLPNGGAWVVGLRNDNGTLTVRSKVRSGGTWSTYPTIPVTGSTVHDLAFCDYNHDGQDDVAVLRAGGLDVWTTQGVLLLSISYPNITGGFLARIKVTGQNQALAVCFAAPTWNLFLFRDGAAVEAVDLSGLALTQVLSMAPGDVTADGATDLVLNTGVNDEATVLVDTRPLNLGGQPTFIAANGYGYRVQLRADAATANVPPLRVVVADMDCDGDDDIVGIARSSSSAPLVVTIARGTAKTNASAITGVYGGHWGSHGFRDLDLVVSTPGIRPRFNAIEAIAFKCTYLNGLQMNSTLAWHEVYPLSSSIVGTCEFSLHNIETADDPAEQGTLGSDAYYLIMRAVYQEASGAVTTVDHALICSAWMQRSPTGNLVEQMTGTQSYQPEDIALSNDGPGQQIGGVTPQPSPPPPPPPTPPEPPG